MLEELTLQALKYFRIRRKSQSRRKSQNKTAHTDIEEIEMNPDEFAQILLSCLKDKEVIKQFRDVTGFQNIQDSVNSLSRNIENLKKTIEAKGAVITALKEEVKNAES